ncbi:putative flavin-containing monooxygenase [Trifolium repens]|nr:putative flavin-containing monooxygenase [Trifolium repens]
MANQENQPIIVSKVGIIGAGVSGIAVAKNLSHYNPIVFEATDSIGGVWKHCSYKCTKLQSQTWNYEFSDFPWPARESSEYPSYVEILEYLHTYAVHFDLFKYVKFNSKVVEIKFIRDKEGFDSECLPGDQGNPLPGHPVWELSVQTNDESDTIQRYHFEFVVVCTGKYGDIPLMPTFPRNKGPDVFNGKVLHTIDYCKLDKEATSDLVKGKKTVVVGYKKSAIDLAMECAQANQGPEGQPCTMIIRSLHWTLPHYSMWGVPFYLFYATRSAQFLHQTPNQGLIKSILCFLLSPLRRGISKFIESYLLWKLPFEKYGLKPEHPFEEDFASCQIAITQESFFNEADKGKIIFKKASKWWFWNGGIEFDDNTKIDADVVLLATGYDGKKKLKTILPEPFSSLLEYPSGMMPLYRGTVHPSIPNMAFVGYVDSVSNLYTSEIRSMWLSGLLDNKFKLPSAEKMLSKTIKDIEIMKNSTRFYKRNCITTFGINHNDEICEDLGWNTWRKKNLFEEAFTAYSALDYKKED